MSEIEHRGGRLRRVGAMWKPRAGSKSLGTGSLTINGLRQKFVVFRNDRKSDGSAQPDYVLMSSDEPETDTYAHDRLATRGTTGRAPADQPF